MSSPPPLILQTVQAPFLINPLYIRFSWTLPKKRDFQWTPKLSKFFIFKPSYLLKVTKFLIEISQFEFLVMTEQSILVYKLFRR